VTRLARISRGASIAGGAPADGWLLTRMLVWRTVLPLLKRRVPLATLARIMWRKPGARIRPDHTDRVIDLAQRLYGGYRVGEESICLERSLLMFRFLSNAGADPQLVVGIRRPGGSVIGHAWVLVDGAPLFEPAASIQEYASFFSFGQHGALQAPPPDGAPVGGVIAG
jgi:Transglutaminase-like superfamily